MWRSRNSTGSDPTRPASSSVNDSTAKLFATFPGARRLDVRRGVSRIQWITARIFGNWYGGSTFLVNQPGGDPHRLRDPGGLRGPGAGQMRTTWPMMVNAAQTPG